MKTMKNYEQFINENLNEQLIKNQVPIKLNLNPGDVIIANEDFDFNIDVDYARFSKSFIGKIKQLNTRNMSKGGERSDWGIAKKGDVLAVVMSNGDLSFRSGWSSNIKDMKSDYILLAYNILYNDNKLSVREYNKNNEFERKLVFKYNRYSWISKTIIVTDLNIEFDTGHRDYSWNFNDDILYIENGFDTETGKGGIKQKLKNASMNDNIINQDGKKLNEI